MKIRFFGLLVAVALTASPALANTWSDCQGNTSGNLVAVKKWQLLCLDFDENGVDSRIFMVGANTALICFDPALDSEGTDVAQIDLRYCPNGKKPAANPENECFKMTDSPITGVTGSAGTQDACHRVGPGVYFVDITTPPAAGDDARVTIQGESD